MKTIKWLLKWVVSLLILEGVLGDEEPYQCYGLMEYNAVQGKVGDMYSPFYAEKEYPPNLWCEYRIHIPEGHRLKLTFKDFDLEPSENCDHDSFQIYGNHREYLIKRLCGNEKSEPIIIQDGWKFVHFILATDQLISGRGFHIQFESSPNFEQCPGRKVCGNDKCYDESQKCNGVDDCGDGTDEEGCDFPLPTVECGQTPIVPDTVWTPTRHSDSPDRIVGGKEVIPNSWPWQVSMQNKESSFSHSCGGSLINAQWIVTAAHCFIGNTDTENWRIHLGKHHKYMTDPYEQTRYVERIIIWPDQTGDNITRYDSKHDIALMKLNAPVKFTKTVQPVCLPLFGWDSPIGTRCYATGWGETRGSGSSDALKQADVFVMNSTNCNSDTTVQICVENQLTPQATCHGDSGGPLVTMLGSKWYIMGLTSYGTQGNLLHGLCAAPNARTVFTKISEKAEWIRKMIAAYS